MSSSLFEKSIHPFVWTTPAERSAVLANVNEPVWHRFLEESEAHFSRTGGLPPPKLPLFCHDGDLDEVMAVAVLAYVRGERRYWHWIADWLREVGRYFRQAAPLWRENRIAVMKGEGIRMRNFDGSPVQGNPRQLFEGFTRGIAYWVEAGFSSMAFHLLDLLEAEAPEALSAAEKGVLLEALADYAARYAFHEEALKYNNRGLWANAGILIAALAERNPEAATLLLHQSARRHEEFRTTFFDDGFHAEGAPDYHIMATDGLLAYLLTASHLWSERPLFEGRDGPEPFGRYPSFLRIVQAYLHTVIPGPVPWNYSRGCSISAPVSVRPALLQAWRMSGDPALGWLIRQRMEAVQPGYGSPLPVTRSAILGLGHYQPLLNFWLYRPVDAAAPPRAKHHLLPDFGSLISRSGWDEQASCVTARFGYEGTGKGHRDHAHFTLTVAGRELIKDPFPRFGPKGLESAPFHNTVILDHREPVGVIGSLSGVHFGEGLDVWMIHNRGGKLPGRLFLHDPREESNYWFTLHPGEPDFSFRRAILHRHGRWVIVVDELETDRPRHFDAFFHTPLRPAAYDPGAEARTVAYRIPPRMVVNGPRELEMPLRGEPVDAKAGEWGRTKLGDDLFFRFFSPETALRLEAGHRLHREETTTGDYARREEEDYYLKVSGRTGAHAVWAFSWEEELELTARSTPEGIRLGIPQGGEAPPREIGVDFTTGRIG